jgi:outer membrane protein OmpA-like peptidoglycan-associated protein
MEVEMAANLLEQLIKEFSGDKTGKIAQVLGENSPVVEKALPAALAALVGALASKGASPAGAAQVLELVQSGDFGAEPLSGMAQVHRGSEAVKDLMDRGKTLVTTLLGEKAGDISNWLASLSGLDKDRSRSLLALLAPLVMGMVAKQVKNEHLNAGGLMGLLAGQASHLQQAAPAGLAGLLGLTSFSNLGTGAVAAGQAAAATSPLTMVMGIAAAVLTLLLAYFMPQYCAKKGAEVAEVSAPAIVPAPTAPVRIDPVLGAFGEVSLPNGIVLNIPELGIEKQLLGFIQNAEKPVDSTTWFTFDRLLFETGSALLQPSSTEQLTNIAEILKAFPEVAVKIGGYTDNVGNPQANLKLSQNRAVNTRQELVNLGIDPSRMEAEGYGDKHPVADNATAEGRQKNRRIDIRVTKK